MIPPAPSTLVTVHDLYTCAALEGLLANPNNCRVEFHRTAEAAVKWADAVETAMCERGRHCNGRAK
jgi:hypothetical protein